MHLQIDRSQINNIGFNAPSKQLHRVLLSASYHLALSTSSSFFSCERSWCWCCYCYCYQHRLLLSQGQWKHHQQQHAHSAPPAPHSSSVPAARARHAAGTPPPPAARTPTRWPRIARGGARTSDRSPPPLPCSTCCRLTTTP
jgi:hypothetical protein